MDRTQAIELSHAYLHDSFFLPASAGGGYNLKQSLWIEDPEWLSKGLKMFLDSDLVRIEIRGVTAYMPLTNVKALVVKAT